MNDLSLDIKSALCARGADLVGFGDLTGLPPEVRRGLPVGISVAVKYPKAVIRGIAEMPTKEYYDYYNSINDKLDELVTFGADALKARGWEAFPQTRALVVENDADYTTLLPHKTVATRAGLGWIGKCALLVTEPYGSMIRLSSLLTNAPLDTAEPVNASKCGGCTVCRDICPAGAVSGRLWSVELSRDAFFDARRCRRTARERAFKSYGLEITQCGKCIYACPYTQRYLNEAE